MCLTLTNSDLISLARTSGDGAISLVSRRLGGARRTGDVDGSEHREATGSEEGATVRAVDRRMGIDAKLQIDSPGRLARVKISQRYPRLIYTCSKHTPSAAPPGQYTTGAGCSECVPPTSE